MALVLSSKAELALKQSVKTPNIALEIDGLSTIIGARLLRETVRIGEPDLEIGDPELSDLAFYIGEDYAFSDQESIINFSGTSTSIKQTLNTDKGEGSSVSSLNVALLDDGFATRLITPGELLTDILARKVRVYMAPDESATWPNDYVLIFRGIISDVDARPGSISLALTSPESKKRSTLFKPVETKLNGAINSSVTTLTLDSTTNVFQKILGPAGTYDSSFSSYVRIDDEIIRFDAVSGVTLTGCTRGQLGTTAASHSDNANVTTFYRLTGNPMDLALKLMLSGFQGAYLSGVSATSFESVDGDPIANSIWFQGINVAEKYGLSIGDYVTTTGATNGANNTSLKTISDIQVDDDGSYIVLNGVTFVTEATTSAVCSFRSKYDTIPDGMKMGGDEVDVEEHTSLFGLFFSGYELDFYLKEEINGREFLEKEIYLPIACYSVPRKARASVGYHIGPLPGETTVTLDETNVKNPDTIRLRRSISRNFYNEVIYKYEESATEDRLKSGYIAIAADSKTQIPAGNKTLIIEARGFRDILSGDNLAAQASSRRLKRYKFGAEVVSLSTLFETGFAVEIGDIVIYDGSSNQLPDIKTGLKGMAPRLFEVQNKTLDLKNGDIQIELVDTNFSVDTRYGLISPASSIESGTSTTRFKIPSADVPKWSRFTSTAVVVRNLSGSTIGNSIVQNISADGTVVVSPALSFTPTIGMLMELSTYITSGTTDEIKIRYAFMRDTAFPDGSSQYVML
jgi:hypothetical protein